jgi:hypothetical protein
MRLKIREHSGNVTCAGPVHPRADHLSVDDFCDFINLVVDSTTRVEVAATTLTADEPRAKARRLILEAFAERTPQVINGDYKVIGGVAAPQKPANGEANEIKDLASTGDSEL